MIQEKEDLLNQALTILKSGQATKPEFLVKAALILVKVRDLNNQIEVLEDNLDLKKFYSEQMFIYLMLFDHIGAQHLLDRAEDADSTTLNKLKDGVLKHIKANDLKGLIEGVKKVKNDIKGDLSEALFKMTLFLQVPRIYHHAYNNIPVSLIKPILDAQPGLRAQGLGFDKEDKGFI